MSGLYNKIEKKVGNLQVEQEHDEIIKSEKRNIKRGLYFIKKKNAGKGAM